jgi:Major Facilitator Superfamily
MQAADAVRGLSQGVVAALLLSGHAHVWQLIVLQVVHGAAGAFYIPAANGLVPQLVDTPILQRANGLLYVSRSVTVIAGPPLAGLIVLAAGPGWAIAADAVTFFISAWQAVRSRTWLWVGLASLGLYQAAVIAPIMVLGPVVSANALGGPAAWGVILSATGVGAVIGGLISLRVRFARPLLIAAFLFLADIPQLGSLAAPAAVPIIASFALLAGAAGGVYGTVWETVVQANVPRDAIARVSSYGWFATTVVQPIGYALVGPAAALIGIAPTLWAAAGGSLLITAAMLAVPSVRRLELQRQPAHDQPIPDPSAG